MAFESLSDKLQNVFKNLRGKGRLTEADVKTALKEVKLALLEADVSFKVVKQFIKSGSGACNRTGRDERTESGTDGDQDRKRGAGKPDGIRDDGDCTCSPASESHCHHDGRSSGSRKDNNDSEACRQSSKQKAESRFW